MSYRIAFLNDEEFEKLPGKDMHTKLGVAYPQYQEAYVRKSGSKLVDTFSMAHELEHLSGNDLNEHFDAENKCYYKDTGQWMQTAAPFMNLIPGIGTVASIGMGAGGTALHQSAVNQQAKQAANQQNQMQNSSMAQFQMPQGQGAPNVVQASGGASGGSGSGGSVSSGGLAPQNSAQGAMQGNQFDPYHPFGQNGGGA